MRNMAQHLVKFSIAVSVGGGVAGMIGCDSQSHSADTQIRADVVEALNTTDRAKAQSILETATDLGGSAASKAQAQSALGQTNLDTGYDLLRQLGRTDLESIRLAWQISQLAGQIQNTNTLASGYLQMDPTSASDEISKRIAEARGGADQAAWFTHDSARIPTLAAVTQDISRLEGEITQIENQIKQLSSKRAAALDESEQSARQAETLEGKPGLDEYKRASDLRKQAADVSIEIDKLEAAALPLRNELAIAQGQRDVLNQVIAQYEQQLTQIQEGWTETQKHADAQNKIASQIAGGDTGDAGIATLGGLLEQLIVNEEQAVDLRAQAETQLTEAAKHLGDAANEAGNIESERKQMQSALSAEAPAVVAQGTLAAVFSPASLKLRQGHAQYLLGTLYAGKATMLSERNRLNQQVAAALQSASINVPDTVNNPDLEKAVDEANAMADTSFQEADTLFSEAMEGQSKDQSIPNAAKVERIFNLYAWSKSAEAAGNAEAAQQHLNDAIAGKQQAEADKIPLPTMPAALGATASSTVAGDPGSAPKAVIVQFADALSKGDADTAKGLLITDEQAAVVDEILPAIAAYQTLVDAVKSKFDDAGDQALVGSPNIVAFLRDGDVVIEGEYATVSHSGLPTPLRMALTGGAWKIDLSSLDATTVETLNMMTPILNQLATDIADGNYATVDDVRQALLSGASGGAQ
jgi:uncharacterized coiled-coil DUF342 family protein